MTKPTDTDVMPEYNTEELLAHIRTHIPHFDMASEIIRRLKSCDPQESCTAIKASYGPALEAIERGLDPDADWKEPGDGYRHFFKCIKPHLKTIKAALSADKTTQMDAVDAEWFFRWIARGKAGYAGMTMKQCADMIWHSPANPYRENNPWSELASFSQSAQSGCRRCNGTGKWGSQESPDLYVCEECHTTPTPSYLPLRKMEDAPKDGTEILILFRHESYKFCKPDQREEWEQLCRAKWIDHNGGGWTWEGICGHPIGWIPEPMQQPPVHKPERECIMFLISLGFTHKIENGFHVVEGHGFKYKHVGLLNIAHRIKQTFFELKPPLIWRR
ncbi:MAG: hypothetical protein DI551_09185 [Micavibrio aeruginosavorus]|uniref:Uncharacterized protein n=1 Tax=Micavibrio aeruginosavorus TaxID=349221 RepID=A0A2W5MVN6_9BACT|nr:MAG: hypothetical protein DI551_09185 [Micavibrio aeruginosavorus]